MTTILYKTKGEQLPTIIFHGDHVYEFVRVGPDLFELETNDREIISFFVDMGFRFRTKGDLVHAEEPVVVEPEQAPPPKVAPPAPPKAPKKAKK